MHKSRVDPLNRDSHPPPSPTRTNGFIDSKTPTHKKKKKKSRVASQLESRIIHCNKSHENYTFGKNSIKTTKYTPLTFFPKNLFEQFRRAANSYFLLVALIQLVPSLSPVNPYSSLFPLIFVLSVTAVKEAVEDWKRRASDKSVNSNPIQVLRFEGGTPAFKSIAWKDLLQGDIVQVFKDQAFPADLLILNSSETQGLCYIETANLDGETNLKLYQALPETTHLETPADLAAFDAFITAEPPNTRLYTFNGTLTIAQTTCYSLSAKQVLLRGCMLKNTDWIYGVVVYCGQETKLMQNATSPPSKRTTLERATNRALMRIFFLVMLVCLIGALGYGIWSTTHKKNYWYLDMRNLNTTFAGFKNFFTYMISFSVMIPISLYVSMEMVKVAQALLIGFDVDMYYEDNDTPAKARTSNLSEELGQIEYIFSDKTGTLTRNQMEFLKCSIGGVSYGTGYTEIAMTKAKREGRVLPPDTSSPLPGADPRFAFKDRALVKDMDNGSNRAIDEFFTLLSVCHTVIPEISENGNIRYQAASPDEGALVEAARNLGFFFHTRNPKDVICDIRGKRQRFEVLAVLEFNSTRKRMSVICRNVDDGVIRLFCKGADTVIMERMKPGQDGLAMTTLSHLEEYANDGLRTLCLSYRILDEMTFDAWYKTYVQAGLAMQDREEKLMSVAENIEKDLILLGATALEDKLQVGVPDAIFALGKAGLKIWILTGDKQETAINIGFACSLLSHAMTILIINANTREETMKQLEQAQAQQREVVEKRGGGPVEFGFVIDGLSLGFALEADLQDKFLAIALACRSVICCRVSPLQKAQVVGLVKVKDKKVTLAIGDGANDVSMIQQAHIGVGISGQEGMQAVMSSDYSIAQFRFLQRLLLVHGRWSYQRVTKLILYSFYKNMVFALSQFWLGFYNGFSGQTMYDGWSITIFNVVFTGLPIIAYAVQERDVPAEKVMKYPRLYETGQKQQEFSMRLLYLWLFQGLVHSAIIFFVNLYVHDKSEGLWELGQATYASVVVTVTFRLALDIHTWTWVSVLCTFGSMLAWFVWMLFIGSFPQFISDSSMYNVPMHVFVNPIFWLSVLVVSMTCISTSLAGIYYLRTYKPKLSHIVQEQEKLRKGDLLQELQEGGGGVSVTMSTHHPKGYEGRGLISPTQSFAIKRIMNTAGLNPPLASSASVESLERFTGFAFSDERGANEKLQYSFKRQNTENKAARILGM